MGKRGFSATTVVLVAVLLGAVFMVSKSVTPPPAAPPAPPKEQTALPAVKANPAAKDSVGKPQVPQAKLEMIARMKEEQKKHHGMAPSKPAFNANSIEVTTDYWHQNQPGIQGEQVMQEKVRKAKQEEAMKRVQISPVPPTPAEQKPNLPRAASAPSPAPGTGAVPGGASK